MNRGAQADPWSLRATPFLGLVRPESLVNRVTRTPISSDVSARETRVVTALVITLFDFIPLAR